MNGKIDLNQRGCVSLFLKSVPFQTLLPYQSDIECLLDEKARQSVLNSVINVPFGPDTLPREKILASLKSRWKV